MKIWFTNNIIKAYKKKSGFISFHLRGQIVFETSTSFNMATYLNSMSSFIEFDNGKTIKFDSVYLEVAPDAKFDGKHLTHSIYLSKISQLTQVDNSIVNLTFKCNLFFKNMPDEIYRTKAFIKKMF